MTIHESQTSSRSNMETGVPGFDEILGGGLVSGWVYLLEGMAGAGKTILSLRELFIWSQGLDVIESPVSPANVVSAQGLSATLTPRRKK